MGSLPPEGKDKSKARKADRSEPHEVLPPLNLNANPNPRPPASVSRQLELASVQIADSEAEAAGQRRNPSLWMSRLSLLLSVTFSIELGLLLAVIPWLRVWTDNHLLLEHPMMRQVFENCFFRGAVTGLGLIDVWLGIWEAVHYREAKR
jgi:hypothetical protein